MLDLNKNKGNRKYPVNESFFDVIDTEEKAYFLGFLYADGYNNTDRNSVAIGLHEKDKDVLEKLNDFIQPTKPLRYIVYKKTEVRKNTSNQYRLCIENSHISKQLSLLGCTKAKTHTLRFPSIKIVPKVLQRHFVRGYFDGDGSICLYKTGVKQYPKSVFSFVSTEEFLIDLQNIFAEELNFKRCKFLTRFPERNNNTRSLTGSGRIKCKSLGEWMYKDATIFMKRKKDKFDEL